MEKMSWIKVLIIALALVIAGYFVGNMHKIGKEYSRSVQVKGLSEREVKADLAVWPIYISLAGNDLRSLQSNIKDHKNQVYQFFVDQGFSNDELTVGTTNINDANADMYGGSSQNRAYRYFAKTDFTIRTKDIEKLQKALEASLDLVSKGIIIGSKNSWRPIEYSFSGLNQLKPLMIEEATRNAREVAEKFAKDSQSKVGKIQTARQGLFSITDRDENTPQIKIVRVVSTIDYLLED